MGGTVSKVGSAIANAANGTLHVLSNVAGDVAKVGSVVVHAAVPHVLRHVVSEAGLDGVGELALEGLGLLAAGHAFENDEEPQQQWKVIFPRLQGERSQQMFHRILKMPQFQGWKQIVLRDHFDKPVAIVKKR